MRDTHWNGKPQKLTLETANGKEAKGAELILQERGYDTLNMTLADMRQVLGTHADFKNETTALEQMVEARGHKVYFFPKFHCELNPIERVWGKAKVHTRARCNYSITGLRKNVGPALDSVSVDNIRRYFRKCRDYMKAYRDGHTAGKLLENAVKVYKSHRKVHYTR